MVVGSGPGGAAVARALARAGRSVVVVERGRDWRKHRLYGTYPGTLMYAQSGALLFTPQGMNVIRPLMLGGATSMFCGCAADPPDWFLGRYGIDLQGFVADIRSELGIAPLPPDLRGAASTRIAEAGSQLGMDWRPQDKFVWPARAARFQCGARCMLGCRCGAKWNAAEWVDDAKAAGALVLTSARVRRVLLTEGSAAGVTGSAASGPFRIEAGTVILAAGGLGTPPLLREAGVGDAGRGVAMDTTAIMYGRAPGQGVGLDPPMSWSCEDPEAGVMYSTLVDPWLSYPIAMLRSHPSRVWTWPRWRHTYGVMIKLKDELSGGVDAAGNIDKGTTRLDRDRLERARVLARSLLTEAGCNPDSIFDAPLRGTHPSATVRIGDMLSADLETTIRGLYVCDASAFPEALGRPTVLTILALADRLAHHLLGRTAGNGVGLAGN